jgi:hypothetical protein
MRRAIGIGLCVVAVFFATRSFRVVAAEEKKTANPLEQYRYPKAEGVGGFARAGNMYCQRLTSSDDFEKVAEFYQKKVGSGLGELKPDSIRSTGSGQAAIDDSGERSVSLRMWIDHTDAYSLTIVVSRTKDEKVTHIVVSYWKRK